jgi:hypothetical protein
MGQNYNKSGGGIIARVSEKSILSAGKVSRLKGKKGGG